MSLPSNAWAEIPNLSGVTAQTQEASRVGDPSRFFAPLSAARMDSITARILNIPCVNVFRNAGIALANATPFVVLWDSVEYDTSGMFSSLTPDRLIARVPGVYEIEAWGQWAASAAVTRRMLLTKVDRAGVSTLYSNPGNEVNATGAGLNTDQRVAYSMILQAGEYVTLTVTQFSGGALAYNGATAISRVNGFAACLKSTFGSESQ